MMTIHHAAGFCLLSILTSTALALEPAPLLTLEDTVQNAHPIELYSPSISAHDFQLITHHRPACCDAPTCGLESACDLEPACDGNPVCGGGGRAGCHPNYVSLFGGWNFLHDYQADFPLPPATAPAALTFEDGFVLGGALGRRFGSLLRGEMEFAFRNNPAESWNLTGAATLPNDGDANFYSIMFNSILDLGTYHNWTPYIGGGIGIGFIDYEGGAIAGPANVTIQDEVFSYQAIVGLSRSINSRIQLFSEYRYFGFDTADVQVAGIPAAGQTTGSTDIENVLFGLRMSF